MNRQNLERLWGETLRSEQPELAQFDRLAKGIIDVFASGDHSFQSHIENRLKQISDRTGENFKEGEVDMQTAQTLIADEIGFTDWDELTKAVGNRSDDRPPILFQYAVAAMERGDFSALESMVGGPERFDAQITEWYENRYFDDEPDTLAEIFSAACMLGHPRAAAYLLDKGVDPLAGIKTGLNGFHYAASSGRLDVVKLLIERKVPMEIRNMYGGTVLGQALWSAVNEHT
ncbi:MAG TPA: ankyrin repeat domain-containing protein, partial [Pyrinomonadaceae bacterium]|nr:ankyrin repeat domain-containing protein [Pyrinomonadaceae bacterium]